MCILPSETALQPIERFYRRADTHPQAIAISGLAESVTYSALRSRVDALAAAFQSLDKSGDRVGICARNTPEHLTALLATYAAGKTWVPLSPRNARADLDRMIATTQPTLVVADHYGLTRFSPSSAPLVLLDDEVSESSVTAPHHKLSELLVKHADHAPVRRSRADDDTQIIKFSGGSTGTPKAVQQSVRCLNAQADGIRDFFEFQSDDVNLIAAPLTHGASCFVLPILEAGGCHILLPEAIPVDVLSAIARHGVTTMYAPPTLLYALMEYESNPPHTLSSLRHVIYSAAPMSPERIRECQAYFGPVIETAYGQVEAPQIITAMRANELLDSQNLTSVGRASSVATIGIMSPEGAMLETGAVGEIVVRGPLLMSGYLHRDDENERAIIDGWLHTGDVGTIDERGYLFIRGRLRELINTGGFKVFPSEVEIALSEHERVAECAVFGAPDAKWGEAVHAAVVVRHAEWATGDTSAMLMAHVKQALGSIKAPKHIWFVSQLERNAAGKVSRASVRAALSAHWSNVRVSSDVN